MMQVRPELLNLYKALFAEYGPQGWWPARTRAEMMIGAILTQNTAWSNVEKALINLRKANALNFRALYAADPVQLAGWIRPAGYFNQKTRYLKALAALIESQFSSSLNALFRLDTPALRGQLLAVKGIGPETADSILLYAAKRPVFVVDAYTRRLLAAYGYKKESKASYNEIASLFTAALPAEAPLYNEYHALIVRWGKDRKG
jgi:endonuclease III related protein